MPINEKKIRECGEPPKEYIEMKDTLKMKKASEPRLIFTVKDETIRSVDERIQFHLNLEKEIIHRRIQYRAASVKSQLIYLCLKSLRCFSGWLCA